MPVAEKWYTGWRGVCLIAITYVYFLIFAQFAFLKRLAELRLETTHLTAVMAAMAIGGILLSLLVQQLIVRVHASRLVQLGLGVCSAAALLALLPLTFAASIAVAFLIGSGLGVLTATLVAFLPGWLGTRNALLKVGLGTGAGYFFCNFPPFFAASPQVQALTSAALCVAGIVTCSRPCEHYVEGHLGDREASTPLRLSTPLLPVIACFTALVWLDSAAFFIIQNTPALKAGTWKGTAHLWLNGSLHLLAALAGAWLLSKRGLHLVLSIALLALACACLLLLAPDRVLLASLFYPVGVSLYSVALVAYPSLLSSAGSPIARAHKAGWIYAVAGWMGSAMGIRMGQNLGHVPPAFVLVAACIVLAPALAHLPRRREREIGATAAVLLFAFCIHRLLQLPSGGGEQHTPVERGRKVYIAEGCIHCHSQYVRPLSQDELLWGPVQTLDALRRERPPLIGNRRQGPDLSEVGGRRSPLWLKAHFEDPAEVSHASFMPTYRSLFVQRNNSGDDLVAYLQSLRGPLTEQHVREEQAWHLPITAWAAAHDGRGPQLFQAYCATCHAPGGHTRITWQKSFQRQPPDLQGGPFSFLRASESPATRMDHLATIVKFGIPGTDMAGHEYLPDTEITSLSSWLTENMIRFSQTPHHDASCGDPQ